MEQLDLGEHAVSFLRRLVEETARTAHISVLSGDRDDVDCQRAGPLDAHHSLDGGAADPDVLHVGWQGLSRVPARRPAGGAGAAAAICRPDAPDDYQRALAPGRAGARPPGVATPWTTKKSKTGCAASARRCATTGRGGGLAQHRGAGIPRAEKAALSRSRER